MGDFEVNRRQYIAEQESKSNRTNGASKAFSAPSKSESESRAAAGKAFPDAQPAVSKPAQPAKGPDPDLIDFFESIEQNQQPMATQAGMQQQAPQFGNGAPYQVQQQPQQFQQNGFVQQQPTGFPGANPFGQPNQQQPFNTGFGGAQQQQQMPQQQMPLGSMQTGAQQTNPFRQSMMANPTGAPGPSFPASPPITSPVPHQSTNPFAKSISPVGQPFSPPPDQQFQQQQNQQKEQGGAREVATEFGRHREKSR